MQNLALLLMRLVFGGAMLGAHGLRKIQRLTSGEPIKFGDPLGIGQELSLYLVAFSEGLCAVFIIVGLFTRLATIPLIMTMFVIIFLVHWDDPFSKIELPLLYLSGFILILVFGGGTFSLDGFRKKLWNKSPF
jgi:putative oxidoreductase